MVEIRKHQLVIDHFRFTDTSEEVGEKRAVGVAREQICAVVDGGNALAAWTDLELTTGKRIQC